MFNASRIRHDFDNAAERYDAHASLQQRVLKQLLSRITIGRNARILDAGCGTGALARSITHKNIIALDNAYRMCRQANHSGNLPVNANMDNLPFADASFDIVFSSLALQWSLNWQATVAELLRVLKPSGMLAFSTFGAGTLRELADSFGIIDRHPHVSHFIDTADIQGAVAETITEYYPDVMTLARHLKALGARNKEQGQRATLMTPRQLRRVESHYVDSYGTPEGLPVSWNIIYSVTQKP